MLRCPDSFLNLGVPRALRRAPFTLVAACSVFLTLGCASVPAPEPPSHSSHAKASTSDWRYALMIDASSSASTLQIFEWQPATGGRLPRIEPAPRDASAAGDQTWELRVRPGLGSYRGEPEAAAASLEPLLNFALEKIGGDADAVAGTSVFLRATAGLRLLSSAEQAEILAAVDQLLRSTPFGATSARVISGNEEGLYGWLTVNYVLGHLEHGGRFPTVGALDLGGASTQITFQPLDYPASEAHALALGSKTYRLYSKSYLGLGQDEARETVGSPACFLVGYPSPAGPGTGDFDACREAIRDSFAKPCSEEKQPCSLFGTYQPPLYGDFVALSAFAYTADFFELGESLRPEALATAGRQYCARSWSQWVEDDPSIADDPFVPAYCYAAAHATTLLTDGYGFPDDSDRITAPLRVQGATIGWTLGALLWELAGDGDIE